ncbi:MAG: isochorismatase family cysteine hydrolase, partial [Actinomycetota bacterium]|nr:isochorismatase family cysteine hydrolase [Actinomycetota bacterium]
MPPRIKELLASGVFDNIVFTRFYNAPGSPYRRILDWHRLSSQHEQQIHSDLLGYADVVLDKGVYSAVTPELLEMLREADAADVFIAGIDTDCCVLTTAVDLFQEGIRPLVLSHYCASNGGADSHTAALTCLGRLIGLRNVVGGQIDADAIEKALEPASPGGDAAVLEKTSDFMVTREDLRRALTGEPATAMARMLEFLEVDFREQLDSDVGVWERYTLREHVFMVIGQYERYFMRDTSGSISSEDMLLVLALHDIGKPAAVAAGDKRRQGEYTRRVAEAFLAHLGFADDHVVRKLIRALSAHDPIGRYLKTGDLEASLRELEDA